MANSKERKLFAEFPPITTEKWEEVITADLKGADYEKKLVWKTAEGFNVRPYYRAENLSALSFLGATSGEFPYVRGVKSNNNWLIHQTIEVCDPKQANKLALDVLMRGVESLGFVIADKSFGAEDLNTLLEGICLDLVEVSFSGCAARSVAGLIIEKLTAQGGSEEVRANFLIDPIAGRLTTTGTLCKSGKCFVKIADLVKLAEQRGLKRLRFVGVNGQVFQNSGSTIVQELAFTLAVGHEYIVKLMEQGVSIERAASSIRFSMSVSSNYFMEIAKFRAARMLWANIVEQYSPKCCCAAKMKLHAETSRWNMTAYDPYVNMLRGTTESMSAAIAGVHSLEVLPFNDSYQSPTEFSSRIARNTQILLKEESHFDQVVDPSGGSYYIENLTNSIADSAWTLFKAVEDKGGYIASFQDGFIQEQVEASAAKKDMDIATRREILLGTNQYPNFAETAEQTVQMDDVTRGCRTKACGCASGEESAVKVLTPYRGAMAFEQMRLAVDRSGKEPVAFMLTVGNLSMARARSQFACNFFACAGIRVQDNTYFESVDEGVDAALASGSQIVVICASDDDYQTLAPQAYAKLGGRATLVVAGAPACQPELEAAGITRFINVRSNVLETLKSYLKELQIQ